MSHTVFRQFLFYFQCIKKYKCGEVTCSCIVKNGPSALLFCLEKTDPWVVLCNISNDK